MPAHFGGHPMHTGSLLTTSRRIMRTGIGDLIIAAQSPWSAETTCPAVALAKADVAAFRQSGDFSRERAQGNARTVRRFGRTALHLCGTLGKGTDEITMRGAGWKPAIRPVSPPSWRLREPAGSGRYGNCTAGVSPAPSSGTSNEDLLSQRHWLGEPSLPIS